ncbi:alpha/beta hydrolase [Caulobacter sp. 17J65-9]|uniref:alpha/beta hydrolase n=1 Tax=Caulobacter sp. 17J65-9 TaxID=2709382 RepID=UPI003204D850
MGRAGEIVIWAATTLAGLYLLLLAGGFVFQRSLMYSPDPVERAPAVDGVPIQVVHVDTADGERLVAWYLPPKDGRPVILFFDGKGGSLSVQKGRWRRIAKAGVGFLAPAYRGYSGSTGRPSEAGLHEDARAAYDWLAKRYAPDQIVVHGFSLGSGVAVKLATERPARALVLEAPYTAAVDVAADRAPFVPVRLLMRDQLRSRDWIGQVRVPVLVVHGDRDSVIDVRYGERLYALARQPKRFERMHGSDHSTLVRDGVYDRIWRFLGVTPADQEKRAAA